MMTVILEKHNAIIGGIVAAMSYVFGDNWALFAIFLLFNVLDYITGIMKSRMAHKESSIKGLHGVMKKFGYWLMVLLSFASSAWFILIGKQVGIDLQITTLLGWFVLASLTVNELRSILENFVEAGYHVPNILVNGLEVADKAFNKQKDTADDTEN